MILCLMFSYVLFFAEIPPQPILRHFSLHFKKVMRDNIERERVVKLNCMKLRVSVAKSRVRSDFLTYRNLKEFHLFLSKYDDSTMQAQSCGRVVTGNPGISL